MSFTVGYIKSEHQFLKGVLAGGALKSEVHDLENLKSNSPDMVIYPDELSESETLIANLKGVERQIPVKSEKEFGLDLASFEKSEQVEQLFLRNHSGWTLAKNLELLHSLYETVDHLKKLLVSDRGAFFEELWNVLRINLGLFDLKLIYNDVKKAKKETEKDKLIRIRVEGRNTPSPIDGTDIDEAIMKSYEKNFFEEFEIIELESEIKKLTATFKINNSPVVIFGEFLSVSPLQKSLIKTLIEGINRK